MIKHDNLRWVFSAGLGRWSEAAIKAYRDKTNKNKIPLSEFAGSMTTATKHCLNEWLGSSQAKVLYIFKHMCLHLDSSCDM